MKTDTTLVKVVTVSRVGELHVEALKPVVVVCSSVSVGMASKNWKLFGVLGCN